MQFYKSSCEYCGTDLVDKLCLKRAVWRAIPGTYEIDTIWRWIVHVLNPLTPNDHYSGRTAPLTSKRCIVYIYSSNMGTEYFKHGIYSSFIFLQNALCFIILTFFNSCIIHILYIGCVKIKKK